MSGASWPGVGCRRETQPSPARSAGLRVVRIVGLAGSCGGHRIAQPGTVRPWGEGGSGIRAVAQNRPVIFRAIMGSVVLRAANWHCTRLVLSAFDW